MLSFEPHLDVTLLRSIFLCTIWIWEEKNSTEFECRPAESAALKSPCMQPQRNWSYKTGLLVKLFLKAGLTVSESYFKVALELSLNVGAFSESTPLFLDKSDSVSQWNQMVIYGGLCGVFKFKVSLVAWWPIIFKICINNKSVISVFLLTFTTDLTIKTCFLEPGYGRKHRLTALTNTPD